MPRVSSVFVTNTTLQLKPAIAVQNCPKLYISVQGCRQAKSSTICCDVHPWATLPMSLTKYGPGTRSGIPMAMHVMITSHARPVYLAGR